MKQEQLILFQNGSLELEMTAGLAYSGKFSY